MPEGYGKWQTVATRFYRWQKTGVWNQILQFIPLLCNAEFLRQAVDRNYGVACEVCLPSG